MLMDWISSPEAWIALATLTVLTYTRLSKVGNFRVSRIEGLHCSGEHSRPQS